MNLDQIGLNVYKIASNIHYLTALSVPGKLPSINGEKWPVREREREIFDFTIDDQHWLTSHEMGTLLKILETILQVVGIDGENRVIADGWDWWVEMTKCRLYGFMSRMYFLLIVYGMIGRMNWIQIKGVDGQNELPVDGREWCAEWTNCSWQRSSFD